MAPRKRKRGKKGRRPWGKLQARGKSEIIQFQLRIGDKAPKMSLKTSDWDEAERIWAEMYAKHLRTGWTPFDVEPAPTTPTFRAFWKHIEDVRQRKLKPRSFQTLRGNVLKVCEYLGDWRIDEIQRRDVIEFRASYWRDHPEVGNRRINRLVHAISAVMKDAIEHDYRDSNPAREIEALPDEAKRIGIVPEMHEIEEVIGFCSESLGFVVIIAAQSGLRRGELANLDWLDVRFDEGKRGRLRVRRETSKTRRERLVPMTSRIRAILEALRGRVSAFKMVPGTKSIRPGDNPVFPEFAGSRVDRVTKQFRAAAKEAKYDFIFHDLRRAFLEFLEKKVDAPGYIQNAAAGHQIGSKAAAHYKDVSPIAELETYIDRMSQRLDESAPGADARGTGSDQ